MKRIVLGILTAALTFATAPAVFSNEREPISNYQVLFSPDDHVSDELISLIKAEKKSIKAAVYCLMHREIVKALIDAYKRGVDVEVIVDPFSLKSRACVKIMRAANLPVFVWNPSTAHKVNKNGKKVKKRKPLMHDKFCVLGNKQVWTGSFNFTFEATSSNRENVIVLESGQIAACYLEEFERLKKAGCVPLNDYLSSKNQEM